MFDYYDRRLQLELGKNRGLFVESEGGYQFRVEFRVLLDWGAYQSYADIAIYGLSRETEAKVFKRGEPIALKAGYANSIDYIFQGEINFIQRESDGPERITRVFATGGSVAQQSASIAKMLGEGSTLKQAITECAKAIGFPVVTYGDGLNVTYQKGIHLSGDPSEILRRLARAHDFKWFIEGSKIVVASAKGVRPGPVHKVSSLTGMEGSPEITEVGANVVTRLNPRIKVGQIFEIKSEYSRAAFSNLYFQDIPKTLGEGRYRAEKIEYEGDTHGNVWSNRITGIRQ